MSAVMSELDLSEKECNAIDAMYKLASKNAHYDLLGVEENATADTIRSAYYKLSRTWHPDRYYRKETGEYQERLEAVFVAITDAYRTLTDDIKRKEFDKKARAKSRKRRGHSREPAPKTVTETTADKASIHEVKLNRRTTEDPEEKERREKEERKKKAKEIESKREERRSGRRLRSRHMQQLRQQMMHQLKKAKRHYQKGKKALEDGNAVGAVSDLHLATRLDPKNPDYKKLFKKAQKKAKASQASQYMATAENAESFARVNEAIQNYKRVIKCDPSLATPHFRLARLLHKYEDDFKGALRQMREAVQKDGDNIQYRLFIAELYVLVDMSLNARREYEFILKREPDNDEAKAGLKKTR